MQTYLSRLKHNERHPNIYPRARKSQRVLPSAPVHRSRSHSDWVTRLDAKKQLPGDARTTGMQGLYDVTGGATVLSAENRCDPTLWVGIVMQGTRLSHCIVPALLFSPPNDPREKM